MDRQDAFIHHPREIPILLRKQACSPSLNTLSHRQEHHHPHPAYGGIRCYWHQPLTPGHQFQLSIPTVSREFWGHTRVLWCEEAEGGYEIGLELLDAEEAFRLRMLEQLCHIHCYRDRVERSEGRQLDSEQAASEWILKFAMQFPSLST